MEAQVHSWHFIINAKMTLFSPHDSVGLTGEAETAGGYQPEGRWYAHGGAVAACADILPQGHCMAAGRLLYSSADSHSWYHIFNMCTNDRTNDRTDDRTLSSVASIVLYTREHEPVSAQLDCTLHSVTSIVCRTRKHEPVLQDHWLQGKHIWHNDQQIKLCADSTSMALAEPQLCLRVLHHIGISRQQSQILS